MPLPHGTVKSGNTRRTNKMGATNRMVSHITRTHHVTRPVSINYLRGLVKQYNAQIDALKDPQHDCQIHGTALLRQQETIMRRELTYNAIKLFQAAYASGDFSALDARMFCRRYSIALPNDACATIRQTGDAVQRVAGMLGAGQFDTTGMHVVSKDGRPRIPGGFSKENGSTDFRELTPEESAFWKAHRTIAPDADTEAPVRFAEHRNSVIRKMSREDYKKVTKGSRNMYFDRVEGKNVVIPNAKVVKDKAAR